jgi:hypothetical protein
LEEFGVVVTTVGAELHCAAMVEKKVGAEASLGASLWNSKSRIGILANNLVCVVNVDSDVLGAGSISADSDGLVPSAD